MHRLQTLLGAPVGDGRTPVPVPVEADAGLWVTRTTCSKERL